MLGRPEEWETITQQAEDEADRILRKKWANVTAIAEALMDRGELDAGALHTIFEETGCSRADASIRRLLLDLERMLLYESDNQLIEEGAPRHEIERLGSVITAHR